MPQITHPPPLGITLSSVMEIVEKVQYQAALAVTGAWQGSSRSKLYEELGWESLSDRRFTRRILQVHKIVDGISPVYLRNKMPPNRNVLGNPGVSLPYVFHNIQCRTVRFSNSFFPDAILSWNNQISNFEHFPNFVTFKKHLLSLFRPTKKSTFRVFNPRYLRHIFQLRLGLSRLNSHKNHHNFADTPSDKCSCNLGAEDSEHYLLSCPKYETSREILISSIEDIVETKNLQIDINLLLYGHYSLNDSDNKKIIEATLEFVKITNRLCS